MISDIQEAQMRVKRWDDFAQLLFACKLKNPSEAVGLPLPKRMLDGFPTYAVKDIVTFSNSVVQKPGRQDETFTEDIFETLQCPPECTSEIQKYQSIWHVASHEWQS